MLINTDCFDVDFPTADLIIVDPPYGGIIKDGYDQVKNLDDFLIRLCRFLGFHVTPGGTLYLFGGIGSYRNRPFFTFLGRVESETKWRLHNFLTWKKRRGYGTQHNYLFTREEIAMLVFDAKRPKTFNVPYLEEERSSEWKKRLSRSQYQPLNDRLRRANVFTDIKELFQYKLHTAEKPEKLMQVLVETSSNVGDMVVDPMCGTGVVGLVAQGLGRRFCLCDKDPIMYQITKDRIDGCTLYRKFR
jgi:DNA modification methylase